MVSGFFIVTFSTVFFEGNFIMNSDEKIEILTKRQYLVVKSNELIQRNRFELSLPEQKMIAFICSMIQPIDPKDSLYNVPFQLEYEFNIRDYCKICSIDYPKEYQFSGSRIHRGMYKTVSGKTFNAYINGALNIMRKSNVVSLKALYTRGGVDTSAIIRVA